MNLDELNIILSRGENIRTEFKTSFSEDVIISLCAFSNTQGGVVFVGVSDGGEIKGVELTKETAVQWANEIKGKTAPSIIPDMEILKVKEKYILVMSVIEYPVKPVSTRGRYYKRVGNSNHLLSVSEVVNMHLKTVNTSWDFYLREDKTVHDISLEKVQKLIETINRRHSFAIADDPLTFLRKFQLISGEKITHACWLLFMPETDVCTTVELGHFSSSTVIKDSLTLRSDLFSEAEDIMEFIRKHINKRVIFNGQLENEERWDYPLEAVRELVINMVLHRDYTASYDSVLKVYDDHIEFYNPGATPPEIDLPHLLSNDYVSQPRNKLIAEVFKAGGLIEKYGSGIRRVLETFHVYGLPQPEFQLLSTGFRVKIFSGLSGGLRDAAIVSEPLVPVLKKIQDDVGVIKTSKTEVRASDLSQSGGGQRGGQRGGQTEEVFLKSDTQKAVLDLIRKNNQITRKEISSTLKISESAIQKHINQLKLKKILVRIGADFGGYWEVRGR